MKSGVLANESVTLAGIAGLIGAGGVAGVRCGGGFGERSGGEFPTSPPPAELKDLGAELGFSLWRPVQNVSYNFIQSLDYERLHSTAENETYNLPTSSPSRRKSSRYHHTELEGHHAESEDHSTELASHRAEFANHNTEPASRQTEFANHRADVAKQFLLS